MGRLDIVNLDETALARFVCEPGWMGRRRGTDAGPGEVIVSGTTRDLLDGSGLRFADRGVHGLKGFESQRQVYALERG